MAVIKSLLDNDFYKFTMMNAVFHQCPGTDVEYEFTCRNEAVWTERIFARIKEEVDNYCNLTFTEDELEWLEKSFPYFHRDFIDFLRLYKPNRSHVSITLKDEKLAIRIKGSWLLTILFEVPLLAIVNQCYFEREGWNTEYAFEVADARLTEKIHAANENEIFFADFGTRRRISHDWQEYVISRCSKECRYFIGTSNLYFAKKYGIKAIGTQAHEWYMGFQGMNVRIAKHQQKALQKWVDEYRGDLGIALTDTVGIDAFLNDFDKYFAKLYDGVRHDSGSPFEWGDKMIEHYNNLGINPRTKSLVFSDGLDFEKAKQINEYFYGRANVSFGIGTNLTNDFEGINPLHIVIKLTQCNGNPVAKLSDEPGKEMCKDAGFLAYIKSVFGK